MPTCPSSASIFNARRANLRNPSVTFVSFFSMKLLLDDDINNIP